MDDDAIVGVLGRFDGGLVMLVVACSTANTAGRVLCVVLLVDGGNTFTVLGPIERLLASFRRRWRIFGV